MWCVFDMVYRGTVGDLVWCDFREVNNDVLFSGVLFCDEWCNVIWCNDIV